MLKIPFYSFDQIHGELKSEIFSALDRSYNESQFILGKDLIEFETEYAAFNKTAYCIGTANGLDSLHLSLKSIGIQKGDEVLVSAHTYVATFLAIIFCGATPIPIDADQNTMNIDVNKIESFITSKTKAIIPVHLYGQPCNMESIMQIANKKNLFVIEDNAQSQGATFNGQLTGTFGIANATSFYPGKNIGALGDGGAITTNDKTINERLRKLRNYGSSEKYIHEIIGYNSRLDSIQASILKIKLKYLNKWNQERASIAAKYHSYLSKVDGIELPIIHEKANSVYHQFVIRNSDRDNLKLELEKLGVQTLIHYPIPVHLQQAFNFLNYTTGDFPITEKISKECLSLPIYPGLRDNQIEYISEAIIKNVH